MKKMKFLTIVSILSVSTLVGCGTVSPESSEVVVSQTPESVEYTTENEGVEQDEKTTENSEALEENVPNEINDIPMLDSSISKYVVIDDIEYLNLTPYISKANYYYQLGDDASTKLAQNIIENLNSLISNKKLDVYMEYLISDELFNVKEKYLINPKIKLNCLNYTEFDDHIFKKDDIQYLAGTLIEINKSMFSSIYEFDFRIHESGIINPDTLTKSMAEYTLKDFEQLEGKLPENLIEHNLELGESTETKPMAKEPIHLNAVSLGENLLSINKKVEDMVSEKVINDTTFFDVTKIVTAINELNPEDELRAYYKDLLIPYFTKQVFISIDTTKNTYIKKGENVAKLDNTFLKFRILNEGSSFPILEGSRIHLMGRMSTIDLFDIEYIEFIEKVGAPESVETNENIETEGDVN